MYNNNFFFACLTFEDGKDRFLRNVYNQLPTYAALTPHKSEGLVSVKTCMNIIKPLLVLVCLI